MRLYLLALAVTLALVVFVVVLLRNRRLKEKYAAVWLAMTAGVVIVGVFPQVAFWLARLVGVQTPANLVFALAVVVLLLVCVQLSVEISGMEEETRTLAEEAAIVRHDLERVTERLAALEDAAEDGT